MAPNGNIDITKFETIFHQYSIEACFSDYPFIKAFLIAFSAWLCAAIYSIHNGTFGPWNTNVDMPFLRYFGGDMLNGPFLMPLSFALVMRFYKAVPEATLLLNNEGIINQDGIKLINNYLNSPKVYISYRVMKFSLVLISGITAVLIMCPWFTDTYSGWADPHGHLTAAAVVLIIAPITLFTAFHIGFAFDQICLYLILRKICNSTYIALKPYHPDGHFGLGPLGNVIRIGSYVSIICLIILGAIIATEVWLNGSLLAIIHKNISTFAGLFLGFNFLPAVLFLPSIPIYRFISAEKQKVISILRQKISGDKYSKDIQDQYEALERTSSILFPKKLIAGFSIPLASSVISATVKLILLLT